MPGFKITGLALLMLTCALKAHGMSPACQPIEYAQLKDSSHQELDGFYCKAVKMSALHTEFLRRFLENQNEYIGRTGRPPRDTGEFSSILGSQSSCDRLAESVAAMLKKQFNAEVPDCDKRADNDDIPDSMGNRVAVPARSR